MCNTSLQHRTNFANVPGEPLSLSTFHFLRNCNRFMITPSDCHPYYNSSTRENNLNQVPANDSNLKSFEELQITNASPAKSPTIDVVKTISLPANALENSDSNITAPSYDDKHNNAEHKLSKLPSLNATVPNIELEQIRSPSGSKSKDFSSLHLPSLSLFPSQGSPSFLTNNKPTSLPAFEYIAANPSTTPNSDYTLMELNRFGGVFPAFLHRRPRGEKRPIPEEQKDEKYYERRKRNNEAAKKSRDARKIREDRIAFRAALLEQENSILRAQILALRDELRAVRQLMNNSIASTVFPERMNSIFDATTTR